MMCMYHARVLPPGVGGVSNGEWHWCAKESDGGLLEAVFREISAWR